jgi:prevent-host-death family protein
MKVVKIAQAKNDFSRYLEFVRRGGRVRILDRDTPVADLVPIQPGAGAEGDPDDDARLLAALERRGLASCGRGGPLPRALLRPGPRDAGAGVAVALLAERRRSR